MTWPTLWSQRWTASGQARLREDVLCALMASEERVASLCFIADRSRCFAATSEEFILTPSATLCIIRARLD